MSTEPEVTCVHTRRWAYTYQSSPGAGWTPVPAASGPGGVLTVASVRISVIQGAGAGEVTVAKITAGGTWSNGRDGTATLSHSRRTRSDLIARAPVWVMELAGDAVRRAQGELTRDDQPAKGTPEYGLWIAAIDVAADAPLRQGQHVTRAGVYWPLITALRASLDAVGVDWRKVHAGRAHPG